MTVTLPAALLYTTGNRTESIKHLRETLRLNPDHPQARDLLRMVDY